jgi:hypothetical protein
MVSTNSLDVIAKHMIAIAAAKNGGTDIMTFVGLPAALVALIGLALYFVGVIRPLAVSKPRYWPEADLTRFSCFIKNRSRLYDKDVTGLSLVKLPSGLRRAVSRWRRVSQVATVLPWGDDVARITKGGVTITKNKEIKVKGELRDRNGQPGHIAVGTDIRIEAWAGSKRSRSKRFRRRQLD